VGSVGCGAFGVRDGHDGRRPTASRDFRKSQKPALQLMQVLFGAREFNASVTTSLGPLL